MRARSAHHIFELFLTLALAAGWTSLASAGAAAPQDQILVARGFKVEIPGVGTPAAVSVEVDPIEIEMQPLVPGGDPLWRTYGPGKPHFGQARFTFRTGDAKLNRDLSAWIAETLTLGDAARKDITISLRDRQGRVARRYNLVDCYPIGFARGGGLDLVNRPCKHCTQAFDLAELEVQIGSITIDAPLAAPPQPGPAAPAAAAVAPDGMLHGFRVEISDLGSDPASVDASWQRVSGGALMLESIESTVGTDGQRVFTPGKAYVSDLKLEGYMTPGRRSLVQWINDTTQGKDPRPTVTIALIGPGGSELDRYRYERCLILRYEFPRLSAGSSEPLREVVVIKPERYADQ